MMPGTKLELTILGEGTMNELSPTYKNEVSTVWTLVTPEGQEYEVTHNLEVNDWIIEPINDTTGPNRYGREEVFDLMHVCKIRFLTL